MKIILNNNLTKQEDMREYPLDSIIRHNMIQVLNPEERYRFLTDWTIKTKLPNNGFLGFLSHAYSNHVKIAISPYDIWILIISEVSKFVVSNPESFRSLFTHCDEKQQIVVLSDSLYEMPMDVLSAALASKINFNADILFPKFSMENKESVEMIQALFCEMASPYYSYAMLLCGLPEIKVLGTIDDWKAIRTHFNNLFDLLGKCHNFENYPVRVNTILDSVISSFEYSDQDKVSFWKDIFTEKNIGSGSQREINGWITHFLIVQKKPLKLENFTNSIGYVRYKSLDTGKDLMSVHGGFDYELDEEDFACLKYSKHIAVKV